MISTKIEIKAKKFGTAIVHPVIVEDYNEECVLMRLSRSLDESSKAKQLTLVVQRDELRRLAKAI